MTSRLFTECWSEWALKSTWTDSGVNVHGNWIGLSPGWVITIWLVHILHEQNHLMEPVQKWVEEHKWTLRKLTGQKIRGLDFSDDRLALCLRYISSDAVWEQIEERLGQRLIRVYDLETGCIRLDATLGTVYHNPSPGQIFQIGKAKSCPVQADDVESGPPGSTLGGRCGSRQSG